MSGDVADTAAAGGDAADAVAPWAALLVRAGSSPRSALAAASPGVAGDADEK
jgi:hypothetical protein